MTIQQIRELNGLTAEETRTALARVGIAFEAAEEKKKISDSAADYAVDALDREKWALDELPGIAQQSMQSTSRMYQMAGQDLDQMTAQARQDLDRLSLDHRESPSINDNVYVGLTNFSGAYTSAFNAVLNAGANFMSALGSMLAWIGVPGFASGGVVSGYAVGGDVKTPLQIVGEEGPELVAMPMGTHVFTASETQEMLSAAPADSTGKAGNITVQNTFSFPNLIIREEADVDRISQKIAHTVQLTLTGATV